MIGALHACLARLAGPAVAVAVEPVRGDDGLMGVEFEAVRKAVEKRRAEFAAGRRAARRALTRLGRPPAAVPQGPHRRPVWPEGVAGSVSHDAGLAIAAVADCARIPRLGIDLAAAAPFPEKLRRQILLTEAEGAQDALEARVTFSAKECVFKAFYGDVQEYFGFGAVEVTVDLPGERFGVRLRTSLGDVPEGHLLEGRFAISDDRLVAVLTA